MKKIYNYENNSRYFRQRDEGRRRAPLHHTSPAFPSLIARLFRWTWAESYQPWEGQDLVSADLCGNWASALAQPDTWGPGSKECKMSLRDAICA
jgi:hypothetical protein